MGDVSLRSTWQAPSAAAGTGLLAGHANGLDALARVAEQRPHPSILGTDDRRGVGGAVLIGGGVAADALDRRLGVVAEGPEDVVHADTVVPLGRQLAGAGIRDVGIDVQVEQVGVVDLGASGDPMELVEELGSSRETQASFRRVMVRCAERFRPAAISSQIWVAAATFSRIRSLAALPS